MQTQEECVIVKHFMENCSHTEDDCFVVPLPSESGINPIGESRVCQLFSLERYLLCSGVGR